MRRIDWYDVDDDAAADARFEELATADPRTPALDNDAVRQMARVLWLGRYDFDRAVELFSPDVVYADRRGVIALPTLTGLEGIGAMFLSVFEVYDDLVIEPTAVRGERLALLRLRMSTDGGAESVSIGLAGLDGEGRIDVMVSFDEDDLAAALEELERRHEELSGDGYTTVERTYARASTALARGDMEAWQSCQARDIKVVDHTPLGTGDLDGHVALDHLAVWRDQTPDFVSYRTRSFVQGDAMLSALAIRGTTPEGNRYEWDYATVARVDTAGLLAEEHFFPIEQWDDARARFDEWSQPPEPETADTPVSATALSNRATRAQDAYNAAFAARDWDAMAASYTDEIVNDDRRTGVSSGVTVGREQILELVRGLVEVGFTTVTTVPIAIRGEGLALLRRTWHQADGFDLPLLAVGEVDADGRTTANVMFDVEDMSGALAELERRYRDAEAGNGST